MQTTIDKTITILQPKLRGSIDGIKFPAFAEIKYDGEYNQFVFNRQRLNMTNAPVTSLFINKWGKVRTNFAYSMFEWIPPVDEITLIGELICDKGMNGDLYEFLSNKENDKRLTFKPFDIVSLNWMNVTKLPLIDRKEKMIELGIPQVRSRFVEDIHQVRDFVRECKALGAEGIVVKDLNGPLLHGPMNWVKIKDKDRSTFQLVFIDPVLERGEIEVNTPQKCVRVGIKLPNKYKRTLKVGDDIEVGYLGILPSGKLRNPTFIRKI